MQKRTGVFEKRKTVSSPKWVLQLTERNRKSKKKEVKKK
jgi:hypothetical protein